MHGLENPQDTSPSDPCQGSPQYPEGVIEHPHPPRLPPSDLRRLLRMPHVEVFQISILSTLFMVGGSEHSSSQHPPGVRVSTSFAQDLKPIPYLRQLWQGPPSNGQVQIARLTL